MILVRHGQTLFNLHFGASRIDPGIEDPGLTELGRDQARNAAAALAAHDVRQLVVSPYRRTLETAAIIADVLDLPVRIEPLVRERFGFVCDVGTPRSQLCLAWPQHSFDHVDEFWWRHGDEDDEPESRLHARCDRFRLSMAEDPGWRHTAVVTHWGVIRALTGRTVGNGELVHFDPTGTSGHPAPAEIVCSADP